MQHEYKIVPRQDDGTFDVFMKVGKGLDFVSNHDSLEEAEGAVEDMERPASKDDFESFFQNFAHRL